MDPAIPAALAVVAAYLIGAIPFAYLVVRAARGIDIRTVGSGNVGATNAGRVLGFRFFLIVFLLDLLKGLLPTLLLPRLVASATGRGPVGPAVFVALATILGHNFPIYLRFRGGKGVATSLGAMFALDAAASLAAASTFVVGLVLTRFVSASSVAGGVAFAAVYFARAWGHARDADHAALSLLIVGLLGMLIVRHRKNFARIAAGTEPRIDLRRRKPPPDGRAAPFVVVSIAALGSIVGLLAAIARPKTLDCGPFSLVPVARADTGHQRAGRLAFADGGDRLAVACPRYNRVVLYRVTAAEALEVVRDIPLEGGPVAIVPRGRSLYVLQRPTSDARHVEAGWWETFDLRGRPIGERFRVGFDPDDLAFSPDGRLAYVLLSGRAEGESNRPAPALSVVDLGPDAAHPREVARLEFDRPGDDPDRLAIAPDGREATVSLAGSDQVASIDLCDPLRPRLRSRSALPKTGPLRPSSLLGEGLALTPIPGREAVRIAPPDGHASRGGYLVRLLPDDSALEVVEAPTLRPMGRLPLRRAANLGGIRPNGLAYSPDRGLLAVSNRQGGSVHLIAIRPAPGPLPAPPPRVGPPTVAAAGDR